MCLGEVKINIVREHHVKRKTSWGYKRVSILIFPDQDFVNNYILFFQFHEKFYLQAANLVYIIVVLYSYIYFSKFVIYNKKTIQHDKKRGFIKKWN